MRLLCAVALWCASALAAGAAPFQFSQNLGAQLPLQTRLVDELGRQTSLGRYFGRNPVIMVFGYYRCPHLCSTLMDSLLQSVQDIGVPFGIVGIGIDPRETPQDAARKLAEYKAAGAGSVTPHLLTGGQDQVSRLARIAGFHYAYDRPSGQYTHPAGFLIVTPQGRISRYFSGLSFDRRNLRLALVEASDSVVGSWTEQVLLLCSHYDPLAGRYTLAVMTLMRVVGMCTLALLVLAVWRLRRRTRRRAS